MEFDRGENISSAPLLVFVPDILVSPSGSGDVVFH